LVGPLERSSSTSAATGPRAGPGAVVARIRGVPGRPVPKDGQPVVERVAVVAVRVGAPQVQPGRIVPAGRVVDGAAVGEGRHTVVGRVGRQRRRGLIRTGAGRAGARERE
jgi:hypothetical protein